MKKTYMKPALQVNEAQVIKQSIAAFIVCMTQMLVMIGFAVGSIALLFVLPAVAVAALGALFFAILSMKGTLNLTPVCHVEWYFPRRSITTACP